MRFHIWTIQIQKTVIWDFLDIFGQNCLCCRQRHVFLRQTTCALLRQTTCALLKQTTCFFLGETRCLLWQDKMCVVARQDLCCGKTRSLLWQDIREAAFGRLHKGGRRLRRRPPLWIPLCLATTEILSCHNRDLVLPQHTSCLATTEILSCHNRDLVFPQQTQLLCVQHRQFWAKMSEMTKIIKSHARTVQIWIRDLSFARFFDPDPSKYLPGHQIP